MAVGGGEKRAEAMASLAGMLHRQATQPEIADWIETAEAGRSTRSSRRRCASSAATTRT